MAIYQYGMSGSGVRELQAQLNKLGGSLAEDGKYGPATSRAVSDFQSDNGLVVDGVAGPATQAMIATRINEKIGTKLTEALAALAKLPEIKELEKFL